jgi:hypothetical protein
MTTSLYPSGSTGATGHWYSHWQAAAKGYVGRQSTYEIPRKAEILSPFFHFVPAHT